MRLAFYCGIVDEIKTGSGVFFTNLLRHMLALRPDAHYLSFLSSLHNSELHWKATRRIDQTGRIEARTVAVPGKMMHFAQTYLRLPPMRLLLGQPYDLYHQMGVATDPAVPSTKLIVSLFDTVSLHWPQEEARLFKGTESLLTRAAAIITLSEYSRQGIIEAFRVKSERVHVIYSGCDHEIYHPRYVRQEMEQTLTALGITGPYLFYLGGQTPRKNLPRLIRAFAEARRKADLPHSLVLAGPLVPLQPEIAQAVEASGCREHIRVLGYIPDEAVPRLYRGSTALVFPSLHEGFGLPVVEAMACGTPVITSGTSSLPEVAGDAALLVNPESEEELTQAILTVVSENETIRAARIKRGINQAQKFSWERCARQHLDLYDEIIARGRA